MNKTAKKTVFTGVFAAMIYVMTMFIKIPIGVGYIHLGDAVLYLCAMVLGAPWACIAGAIGEGLADVSSGFAVYFPATVIIKILLCVPFFWVSKSSDNRLLTARAVGMTLPAGVITVLGYWIADSLINKAYALTSVWFNLLQAVGSAAVFVALAYAADKTRIFQKIDI